ncbi:MAG TPA: DUF6504 family protein, partial [Armatimonadota bacterium]
SRGCLRTIAWRGNVHSVKEELDAWEEAGSWWEGERARRFHLVTTHTNLQCELCFEPQTNLWTLCRVWD